MIEIAPFHGNHWKIKIVQKEQTTTKNTKSYSENFIRIIHNNPKNIPPKSSEDIKNRIKAASTKHIKTDFLYTLPRWGIAIHLHSKEDMEKLEKGIGKIYPESSCTIQLSKQDNNKLHLEICKQYKALKIFVIYKSTSTLNHLYYLWQRTSS